MPSFPLHFRQYSNLAAGVAGSLVSFRTDDPLRPYEAGVLVASSGVAASIARELTAGRSAGIAALQLQTLESFAKRLVNDAGEFPRIASDAERRLAMRAAARTIDDPIAQSRGIGAMLERSYRDLRDSGLTLAAFRKRIPNARLRNAERTRLLVRAWTEYERFISLVGAVDAADVFARAASIIDAGAAIPMQIVAGFYDMTGVQRALVEALARAGKIAAMYVPAGESDGYAFAAPLVGAMSMGVPMSSSASAGPSGGAGGVENSTRSSAVTSAPPLWSVAEYDRRDAEIRGVCRSVAALLADGVHPQSIGIVARSLDDADVHLFNRFAAEQGFRTSMPGDTPLIAHRFGRAAIGLLKLREHDFRRAEVLEVVRDGLRTQTLINVDAADQETRKRYIAGGTSAELRQRGEKSLVIGDYINLVAEMEELTAPLTAQMMRGSQWSNLLALIVSRFAVRTASDLAAIQQLEEVAALFARADRMSTRFDVAAVVDTIEQATVDNPAVAESLPSVWLGDVMRFRGRTFEHLFAVRMQDEIFPQRRTEDPILPDSDRRSLGVREIGDGRAEERLLFQLIADGAPVVVFSFSASDGFGKVLRPSQLLKNFVIEQLPERKQELLENFSKACGAGLSAAAAPRSEPGRSEPAAAPGFFAALRASEAVAAQNTTAPIRQLQLIARAGTNGVFDGFISDPLLLAHFAAALEHVSPTQLEDFGECPQKFLLKHILRVTDIEDPDRELEINVRDKGSLNHRILEHFYRGLSAAQRLAAQAQLPQLPAAIVAALEAEIDREFDRLAAEAPPFNRNVRDIERRASRRILRDFVAMDLEDLASEELVPRYFEYGFGDKYARRERGAEHPEPFVVMAAGIPVRVEGQIDRIDVSEGVEEEAPAIGRAPEVRYRIVDYKSGKALRHFKLAAKISRGVRLQLALYAMAVSEFFGVDESAVSGTIKPIGGGNLKQFGFELAEQAAGVRETLDTFATAITRGMFPAFPDDDDIGSCKYCPVNETCRTRHDGEERYAVSRSNEPRTLLQQLGARA